MSIELTVFYTYRLLVRAFIVALCGVLLGSSEVESTVPSSDILDSDVFNTELRIYVIFFFLHR